MKIVIATFGSTGDVQPFLALGVELLRRGHEVILAAPPNFAPRAARHGLGFRGLGSAADDAHTLRTIALASEQAGMDEQIRLTLAVPMKYADASVRDLVETAGDADALVSIPYLAAGQTTAELLGLPFVSAHFSPFGSSRRPRLSAVAAPSFNALRKRFGLHPIAEPLGVDGISPTLALTPVSPSIFPRPASWPIHHHVTGFWFLDEPAEPDPALQAFLAAGDPPVVIGFGSMAHHDPQAVTRILLRAVDAAQVRAVIQSGWSGLIDEHPSKNVMFTSFVPHAWLFPKASCIVHAGGAGTTAAGMRAGIPSVFVPHWLDQFLWGALARERRLASASIPIRELDPEALAAAMLAARDSTSIRESCAETSRAISAEDGVAVAAGLIEALRGRRGAAAAGISR